MAAPTVVWDTDMAVATLVIGALVFLIILRGGLKEVIAP